MKNLTDYISERLMLESENHTIAIKLSDVKDKEYYVEQYAEKLKSEGYNVDDIIYDDSEAIIQLKGFYKNKDVLKLYKKYKSMLVVDNSDWTDENKLLNYLKKKTKIEDI